MSFYDKGGNLLSLIKTLKIYRKYYANYLDVLWNIKQGGKLIKAKLRNGIEYTANSSSDLWLKYIENSYKIKLNSRDGVGDWFAVFIRNDYEFLKPENEVVIDIGGEVGDSAIYFSLKGATKVIVFEPFPNNFKYLAENIKINNLSTYRFPIFNHYV